MITRENIIHFYTKYKENLKTEDQIQENLLKAEDQEAWIENLKNKSRMMRRLYIENEALLNLYIRPFLDGEASLNEELAREFLHQIRMADDEGYEDNLAMLEILELLEMLNKTQEKTIALVIHDLNQSARFSDWIIAMRDGKVLYEGTPEEIMTPEVFHNVFSLDAYMETDPWTQKPMCVTYRLEK